MPINQYPAVVVLGATGAGKTSMCIELAKLTGLEHVDCELVAQDALGHPLAVSFVEDPERATVTLVKASRSALVAGGNGAGAIVELPPSAPLNKEVAELLEEARGSGTIVVGLDASIGELARRAGLNAAQPGFLGTPRAWFRQQYERLMGVYGPIVDYWFNSENNDPIHIAAAVQSQGRLRLAPDKH